VEARSPVGRSRGSANPYQKPSRYGNTCLKITNRNVHESGFPSAASELPLSFSGGSKNATILCNSAAHHGTICRAISSEGPEPMDIKSNARVPSAQRQKFLYAHPPLSPMCVERGCGAEWFVPCQSGVPLLQGLLERRRPGGGRHHP
jgi:hypothetical protein